MGVSRVDGPGGELAGELISPQKSAGQSGDPTPNWPRNVLPLDFWVLMYKPKKFLLDAKLPSNRGAACTRLLRFSFIKNDRGWARSGGLELVSVAPYIGRLCIRAFMGLCLV